MFLDEEVFRGLNAFSNNLCRIYGIEQPHDTGSLQKYLDCLKDGIDNEEINASFIGFILHRFVVAENVRDRNTSARTCEDIFAHLVGVKPSDTESRENPFVPPEIMRFDRTICERNNHGDIVWSASADLSANKREKADHQIGGYQLSMKTLNDNLYDINGNMVKKSINTEMNIGSISERALFYNLADRVLTERKGGLGSKVQMVESLSTIARLGNYEEFKRRAVAFLNYIYEEDFFVVYKGGYRMTVYLIPNRSFLDGILNTLTIDESIDDFANIVRRWETHNCRIDYPSLIQSMDYYGLPYYRTVIDFSTIFRNRVFIRDTNLLKRLTYANLEEVFLNQEDM